MFAILKMAFPKPPNRLKDSCTRTRNGVYADEVSAANRYSTKKCGGHELLWILGSFGSETVLGATSAGRLQSHSKLKLLTKAMN